jgi:hypothetical protein
MTYLILLMAYGVLLIPAMFFVGVGNEVLLKLPLSPRARRRWFVALATLLCTPVMMTYLFAGGVVPNALLLGTILFGHWPLVFDYVLFFWLWIPGAVVTALIASRAPERWFVARKAVTAP